MLELIKKWKETFYEGGWKTRTLDTTPLEEDIIKELLAFLPRHMPVYDWNRPFAEEIILILRRVLARNGVKL